MRIIKRTNQFGTTYVVQDEAWNGAAAYQNSLSPTAKFGKQYSDIKSFDTHKAAQQFAYYYENNLQPGEEIVG